MQSITTELTNPVFWMSAVFVALVVNLIAAYLKGPVDGILSSISIRWSNASNRRRGRWHARVALIASSDAALENERHSEIRSRLQAIAYLLMAFLLGYIFTDPTFTPSKPVVILLKGFGFFLGAWVGVLWILADDHRHVVTDAIRFRNGLPLSIKAPDPLL